MWPDIVNVVPHYFVAIIGEVFMYMSVLGQHYPYPSSLVSRGKGRKPFSVVKPNESVTNPRTEDDMYDS